MSRLFCDRVQPDETVGYRARNLLDQLQLVSGIVERLRQSSEIPVDGRLRLDGLQRERPGLELFDDAFIDCVESEIGCVRAVDETAIASFVKLARSLVFDVLVNPRIECGLKGAKGRRRIFRPEADRLLHDVELLGGGDLVRLALISPASRTLVPITLELELVVVEVALLKDAHHITRVPALTRFRAMNCRIISGSNITRSPDLT